MTRFADWCAFLGAWLLFAGPIYQAESELDAEAREGEELLGKARTVQMPPPISRWWWLLPPVAWTLMRLRGREARARVREILNAEETEQFVRFSQKATGWLLVAGGAGLIGVAETWNLREAYEWPSIVFWRLAALMVFTCLLFTAARAKIRNEVLGLERAFRSRRSRSRQRSAGGD